MLWRLNVMSPWREMKKLLSIITIFICCFMYDSINVNAQNIDTSAETTEQQIDFLLFMNPDLTSDDVEIIVHSIMESTGATYEQVIKQVYTEAYDAYTPTPNVYSSGNGSVKEFPYGEAGNVMYDDGKTLGINHGHSAIYIGKATIIDAPGSTSNARYAYKSGVKAGGHVYKGSGIIRQWTRTNWTQRNNAARTAMKYVKDKIPYDTNFIYNKMNGASKMNCSELVWRAYKAQGVDLDSNGGWAVYPKNILNSKLTVNY